jgi:hypothetical protein
MNTILSLQRFQGTVQVAASVLSLRANPIIGINIRLNFGDEVMNKGCFVLLLISLLGGCAGLPGGGAGESTETSTSSGQPSRGAPNDTAITAAIKSAMQQDELLAGTSVTVVSEQGIVTLSGQLSSARAANRAFSVARNTDGVRRVISNLTWPSP